MEESPKLDLSSFLKKPIKSRSSPSFQDSSKGFLVPQSMKGDPQTFLNQDHTQFTPLAEFKNQHITKDIAIKGLKYITLSQLKKNNPNADKEELLQTLRDTETQLDQVLSEFGHQNSTTAVLNEAQSQFGVENVCRAGAFVDISSKEGLNSVSELLSPDFWSSPEDKLPKRDLLDLGNKLEYELKARAIKAKLKNRELGVLMFKCGDITGNVYREIAEKRKNGE